MTAATSVSTTDSLPIVQGTVTKKITPVVLFSNIPTDIKYSGISVETGAPDTVQSGAMSITTAISYLSNITTGDTVVTLANGIQGQEKTVVMTVRDTNNITLTPTNLAGAATSISFIAVGQTCVLKFMNGSWNIMSIYGATVI